MEKKRRARINASLTELKTFLLDIIKKEVDILLSGIYQLREIFKFEKSNFRIARKIRKENKFTEGGKIKQVSISVWIAL